MRLSFNFPCLASHRFFGFINMFNYLFQTIRPKNGNTLNERRLRGIFLRQVYFFKTFSFRLLGERQSPANSAQSAVQPEFAQKNFFLRIEFNIARRQHISKGDGQIKKRPFFFQVGRRKGNDYFLIFGLGRLKTGIFYRSAYSVLRFIHRFIRKPNDAERMQASRQIHLNCHNCAPKQINLCGIDFSETHKLIF